MAAHSYFQLQMLTMTVEEPSTVPFNNPGCNSTPTIRALLFTVSSFSMKNKQIWHSSTKGLTSSQSSTLLCSNNPNFLLITFTGKRCTIQDTTLSATKQYSIWDKMEYTEKLRSHSYHATIYICMPAPANIKFTLQSHAGKPLNLKGHSRDLSSNSHRMHHSK